MELKPVSGTYFGGKVQVLNGPTFTTPGMCIILITGATPGLGVIGANFPFNPDSFKNAIDLGIIDPTGTLAAAIPVTANGSLDAGCYLGVNFGNIVGKKQALYILAQAPVSIAPGLAALQAASAEYFSKRQDPPWVTPENTYGWSPDGLTILHAIPDYQWYKMQQNSGVGLYPNVSTPSLTADAAQALVSVLGSQASKELDDFHAPWFDSPSIVVYPKAWYIRLVDKIAFGDDLPRVCLAKDLAATAIGNVTIDSLKAVFK